MFNRTTSERFYANTIRVGECLIWQGKGRIGPYGVAGYQHIHWLAHRLSYYFATGSSPEVVRHTCDTPLCVEPMHLRAGTHADNVADKVERQRHRFKESHPMRKLVQKDVDDIRAAALSGESQLSIGSRYDVSKSQISRIIRNERW